MSFVGNDYTRMRADESIGVAMALTGGATFMSRLKLN